MKMTSAKQYDGLEIAIIGISAQFPGSNDYREFWNNLAAGSESLQFLTDEELKERGVDATLLNDAAFVKTAGGVLSEKETFDNGFFGYTVEEATLMDPQIRLFHKHCWNALEDAGYTAAIDKKKIGLFAGASGNTNWKIHLYGQSANSNVDPLYLSMISTPNFINTLVAYKLNLRGPVFYVDSACSTSLGAIHLACRSLLTRECALALAGGISIQTTRKKGYKYHEGRISSNDGHCRTFDKDASGTAVGEGAGVIVLKRLSEAMKDGDNIYAIIRATAVNNDGAQKVGYTAPSVKGQAECIAAAMKMANVEPGSISYVEAHGTATRLGDPIEVRALNEAFALGGKEKTCAIGSVKSNVGHLDTAAGVAGLIKTALCLQHRQLVPSLHFKAANPEIDFNGGPFFVNTNLQSWEGRDGQPLRAGVSSFGIGGTNAHAILEEAPVRSDSDAGRKYKLLTVSAKTAGAVERYLSSLRGFLEQYPATHLADLSYTLQVGRKAFPFRSSLSFTGYEDLLQQLRQPPTVQRSAARNIVPVFLFPGQGSQYMNMALGLYEEEPLFRAQMDEGFALLQRLTGADMKQVLFHAADATLVNHTRYTQPLLFLVEYSLSRLLLSLGINPQYMLGHSIGEYVAACISGVFSFEDALLLVSKRGELMERVPVGVMVSVPLSAAAAADMLTEGISLAAVNGPEQVVFSGDPAAMSGLQSRLDAADIPYVQLHTSHAFHSSMQDIILPAFLSVLQEVKLNKPQTPFISNLTGNFIQEEAACSAQYWVDHLRNTVQFSAGVETLLSLPGELVFIEVGAGHSLSSLLKQHGRQVSPVNLLRSVKIKEDDQQYFLSKLGELWRSGIVIDWEAYHQSSHRRRISLPTYSFEPVKYPVEVDPFSSGLLSAVGQGLSDSGSLEDWLYYPLWKRGLPAVSQGMPQSFLLVGEADDFHASLQEALRSAGHEVVMVTPGTGYRQLSPTHYEAELLSVADYTSVLSSLDASGITLTDILYTHGLASTQTEEGLYLSLSYLVGALVKQGMMKDRRIAVLTDSLHQVHGNERGDVRSAILLGLVNVLPQEYAVNAINIDIIAGEASVHRTLTKELTGVWSRGNRIVALRGAYRWMCDYQQHRGDVTPHGTVLHPGGLYLVTGGLGNAGYVLSSYLRERYNARLILTGRRSLSSLDETAADRYRQLQVGAAHCSYHAVDVADEESLSQLVAEIEAAMGRIDGIIHTAGVIDERHFELISDTTESNMQLLFSAKVSGVRVLEKVFRDRRPDFIWVSSSLSSVLGGLGFSAYASANIFMDHFLLRQQDSGIRWRSVCLGGMAFSAAQIAKEQGRHRVALKPEELYQLFEWSLECEDSPVVIQTVESLSARLHRVYEVKKDAYLDTDPSATDIVKTERPALATAYVAPATATEQRLSGIFEQFFGIDRVGTDDNFFELGGDSLKGMMLLKRVKNEFNVNITLTDLLLRNNIAAMATRIDELTWLNAAVDLENEIII